MKFFGIDLGWSTGASGLCCLYWNNELEQIDRVELGHLLALDDIFQWISDRFTINESAVVAVDAPTLIPNETGMRLCDRLAHKHFGKYHAGCYPANLGRPFAQRTLEVGTRLETLGFIHRPNLDPDEVKPSGRYQLEVFPHAAMLHLFQLDQILKYKKGRLAERRVELVRLRELILDVFPGLTPCFSTATDFHAIAPDIPHKGKEMKAVEDQLDSLVCAYAAAHWWYWGANKNWVLGDRTTGYIVVPTPFGRLG
ncbi:MAG: DUF429 domain-containing protein [Cyanobacteria bacterium P01_F01_bin.150]